MSNFWPKFKIWTRVGLIGLLVIYAIFFLAENSGQTVNVWYWYNSRFQSSLLLFSFMTFIVGFLAALLVGVTIRMVSHLRQLQTPPLEKPKAEAANTQRREESAKQSMG